jgi:hypothetical protein
LHAAALLFAVIGSIVAAPSTEPRAALASHWYAADAGADESSSAAMALIRSAQLKAARDGTFPFPMARNSSQNVRHVPNVLKTRAGRTTKTIVDQVSLPMRIALLAVLAFAGVWLVALRPKPVAGPADAPPPVTATAKPAKPAKPAAAAKKDGNANGITSAADKAKDAVAGANTAAAKAEGAAKATGDNATPAPAAAATAAKPATAKATPATAVKPATTAKPATAAKPDPASKAQTAQVREILAELDQGKVAVLLFWERQGSDDRAVRRALAGINLHGGKVEPHIASIDKLAQYETITRGVPVVTSPSVLVIDKNRRARVISGLTITREIDQAVGRALR